MWVSSKEEHMKKKIYVCPKHKDQVLYVEVDDPSLIGLIIPKKPEECPKCKKAYYKRECVVKQ